MRTPAAFVVAAFLTLTTTLAAAPRFACLPTCSSTDGRFLSLADSQLGTSSPPKLTFVFALSGSATALRFAVFDGEATGQWDSADGLAELDYALTTGRSGRGQLLHTWSKADFADNAWTTLSVPTSEAARAADGNFYYRFEVRALLAHLAWTHFKLRVEAGALLLDPQPVAFNAALFHADDLTVIYPAFPALEPTTYDGSWDFHLLASSPLERLVIWDGDLDFGSADCRDLNTDDPETASTATPAWAIGCNPEGVALGQNLECGASTGAPADDGDFAPFRRPPSVQAELIDPNGAHFLNANPSGNLEWEAFVLATNAGELADFHVAALPAGLYHLRWRGLDLGNLGLLRAPLPLLGVDQEGQPILPPAPRR